MWWVFYTRNVIELFYPCRLFPHVVVVVGLSVSVTFGAMQVELLMPDRPKMRDLIKEDMAVYAVRRRWRFSSRTRLLITRDWASEPVTA